MESDVVIFWFVVLSCTSGLAMVLWGFRSLAKGWAAVYLAILLVAVIGRATGKGAIIYWALGMWFVLVLFPSLLLRWQHRQFLQQRYASARRLATIVSWLHPADGWRQQPEIIRALELAQQGDLSAASEVLRRFQGAQSLIGLAAVANLYRLTNQWEQLLAWERQLPGGLERYPQLLSVSLRAYGETGDRRGLVQLYERNKARIARLVPAASRDMCRLMLFAFYGQVDAVQRLMAGSLSILPASGQQFWLATTDLAAGATESGKKQLEALLPEAGPAVRLAIERRLSRIGITLEPPDPSAQGIIAEAARDQTHDEQFGASRSLFSKQARATQILIVLNVLVFLAETLSGGATNPETLYRLGAMFPPAVFAGAWWRLVAALFLHWGSLHLVMNMIGLWILGPFTEFALGIRQYLLVYLLSGIGSMGALLLLAAAGRNGDQLVVGASGCIMGLVGATGALMLRGWLREKALSAKRRLIAMLLIIAMQTTFDSLVPQVSMTAHLSGALIGFIATLALRQPRRQPATASMPALIQSK